MEKKTSINDMFERLLLRNNTLKLTALRKDILKLFIQTNKPMSAYEVLTKLKKKRDNAEPPTVYRVIDYFIQKNIIHRIDAQNKYIICTQLGISKSNHHGILFICNKCNDSFEVTDKSFVEFLAHLSKEYQFTLNGSPVEIKGICQKCAVN